MLSLCVNVQAKERNTILNGNEMRSKVQMIFNRYCEVHSDLNKVKKLLNNGDFTPQLVKMLNEDFDDFGYDYFTCGRYDYEIIQNKATFTVTNNCVTISFLTQKNLKGDLERVNVNWYFDTQGKVSHIERCEDGYVIPEDIPIDKTVILK